MRIPRVIAVLLVTTFGVTRGAPADDMENLQTSCENGASVLNSSLNDTAAMNTSSLVQNIVWQVGASTANLGVQNVRYGRFDNSSPVKLNINQSSSAPLQSSNTTSNTTSYTLDTAYFNYVDALRTFAEAVLRRGRIYHQEMNYPVFNSLQSLATAVQTYGFQLGNAGMISRNAYVLQDANFFCLKADTSFNSTIRTFTAGSSLMDAQSAWANNANYPGVRYGRRRVRRSTHAPAL